ncbi:MAG: DUF3611 family protein [Cyanobacteria bacterium P01_G01_bin.4]
MSSSSSDRMRKRMRTAGQISFWVQIVLAILSVIFWTISVVGQLSSLRQGAPGGVVARWAAFATLVSLGLNTFFTFRYWKGGEKARLKVVLYIGLIGAFLATISSLSQVGELLVNVFFYRQSNFFEEQWDFLLLAVNNNVTFAHLISLTCILWIYGLFDRFTTR